MAFVPERWQVESLADRLVRELQREISLAQSFFHEASVLVLVFGILDAYVSDKLTKRFAWFIVSVTIGSYIVALLMEWIARWLFRVWAWLFLLGFKITRWLER